MRWTGYEAAITGNPIDSVTINTDYIYDGVTHMSSFEAYMLLYFYWNRAITALHKPTRSMAPASTTPHFIQCRLRALLQQIGCMRQRPTAATNYPQPTPVRATAAVNACTAATPLLPSVATPHHATLAGYLRYRVAMSIFPL